MSLSTVIALNEPSHRFRQHRLQRLRRDGCVREHVGQHRRHVRRDHARALGDAVDDDFAVPQLDAGGRDLRIGVGGHDRLGGGEERVLARVGDERVDNSRDAAAVERLADNAGRGHEDFAWGRADRLGGGLGDMGDRSCADAAGEGVGVAGIDDQRARLAAVQMLTAPVDGRRGALRAGEHARDRRRPVEQRHHDVGSPRIAHPRRDRRKTNAGDRRQGGIGLRRQRRERGGSGHERFRSRKESGQPALAWAQSEVRASSACRPRRGASCLRPSGPRSPAAAACRRRRTARFWPPCEAGGWRPAPPSGRRSGRPGP